MKRFSKNFITVINQAEIAYREFLGSNRVRLEPGLRLNLPWFHNIKRIDMREKQINISSLSLYTKENIPIHIDASIFYKPISAEKMCYGMVDLNKGLLAISSSLIRNVAGRFEYDEINSKRSELTEVMMKEIDKSLDELGIACSRLEIQEIKTTHDMARDLELQAKAERKRRENELDTMAAIKTAEGQKQQNILISEGESIRIKNTADAEKYRIETLAIAECNRIKVLTTVLDKNAPFYFIELERLKHLQELSKSNNKVYFMDPKGMFPSFQAPLILEQNTESV